MIKDIKNTIIFVICGLVILASCFFARTSFSNKTESITELAMDEEVVVSLSNRLLLIDQFRDTYKNDYDIDNLTLLHYVFDNLSEEDYEIKTVSNKKIVCKVNNSISFTSSRKCDIAVVSNDTVKTLVREFLGRNLEIAFEDFDYKALKCKNDGSNYYCLMQEYTSLVNDYSVIKKAFKRDGKIVIQDYYLSVNIDDEEMCNEYYDSEYCSDYSGKLKPDLSVDDIIKFGVLYELTFNYGEFGYYLESVDIV